MIAVPKMPPPARLPRLVLLPAFLLGLLSVPSCDCGREGGDPVVYAGGDTTGPRYVSSELYGTWLHFPAGRRYQLLHELPEPPSDVLVYLAFREDALREDDAGNISPSSGNAALVEAVEDDYIQVRNDTCSEYWVRVVAEVAPSSSEEDEGGGGSAGGGA